jgi:hypothetical protein
VEPKATREGHARQAGAMGPIVRAESAKPSRSDAEMSRGFREDIAGRRAA